MPTCCQPWPYPRNVFLRLDRHSRWRLKRFWRLTLSVVRGTVSIAHDVIVLRACGRVRRTGDRIPTSVYEGPREDSINDSPVTGTYRCGACLGDCRGLAGAVCGERPGALWVYRRYCYRRAVLSDTRRQRRR